MNQTISYSKAEHDALMQAAREHAHALRQQAIRDVFDAAGDQAVRALRAANRLAHSLARHARLRAAQGAEG